MASILKWINLLLIYFLDPSFLPIHSFVFCMVFSHDKINDQFLLLLFSFSEYARFVLCNLMRHFNSEEGRDHLIY